MEWEQSSTPRAEADQLKVDLERQEEEGRCKEVERKASQRRIAELEDEEKHRASKQQEDAQRIIQLQQCVMELVQEMEQYHTDEGLLAEVEREAT
ncbi:hypothetical protein R1flu_023760 [Riccia fluitans]|uniref:Uncharacterized protein n=1 Tax=Riccia fluitans TaxID=41844 RepID=A0ABD1XSY3_9MARC